MRISTIDEIVNRHKSIEEDLRRFGLDGIGAVSLMNHKKWSKYSAEIRFCDIKVDVHKLQLQHKKLTAEIHKSQESIKALEECLETKVNESERDQVAQRRKAILEKLESKQKEIDKQLLAVIKKVEDLG